MPLSPDEITEQLADLDGWIQEGKAIRKQFELEDFTQAMEFVMHVAEIAEELDHHPDIDIRFNQVTVSCSTHDEGGLTIKDFELAARVEEQAGHDIVS